jgi:iron complex outermembrane receptor protein
MSHAFGGATIDPVSDVPGYLRSHNAMSEVRDTVDVDIQYRFSPLDRNELICGTGYRFTQDQFGSEASNLRLNPDSETDHRFSAFVQDEIAIIRDRLDFTLGSKFEHNEINGSEFQPGARLMWTANESQSVWASVARAVRTPTRMERALDAGMAIFTLPDDTSVLVRYNGSPNLKPEKLIAYELGYRIKPATGLSFDIAGFYNHYDDLIQTEFSETQPGSFEYANASEGGDTYGAELLAQWQVTDCWRLTGNYSWLKASVPGEKFQSPVNPEHQFHVRSQLELADKWTLDTVGYFFHRTEIKSVAAGVSHLPGYFRFDVGLTWRPSPRMELSLWGQNLLDDGHMEFWSVKTPNTAEVPRTFFAKFTLHY